MRLEGTHLFAAPRTAVWEALMDPGVLARALPGGEEMEMVDENRYRAVMNIKVGPVQGRFEGKIELDDIVAPVSYLMRVDGQGAPGFVNGEGQLHLLEQEGGTLLTYAGDVNVGGRIAGVGQRLVESTARSVTRQGLVLLDQMIQARLQSPIGEAAAAAFVEGEMPSVSSPVLETPLRGVAASSGPSAQAPQLSLLGMAGEVAKDVAKDLTKEYIAEDQQERVLYFSLGVLAMLLFTVLVRLVQRDTR